MPSECGNVTRSSTSKCLSRPTASIVDAKSPKPSIVRIAASSNGETKNALATCAWWCSTLWNCARNASCGTESAREILAHVTHPLHVANALEHVARIAQPSRGLAELRAEVRPRISADRGVVELARIEARVAQAPGRGQRREARHVLDAVEAFFL